MHVDVNFFLVVLAGRKAVNVSCASPFYVRLPPVSGTTRFSLVLIGRAKFLRLRCSITQPEMGETRNDAQQLIYSKPRPAKIISLSSQSPSNMHSSWIRSLPTSLSIIKKSYLDQGSEVLLVQRLVQGDAKRSSCVG
jgi:hypothetical protein